MNFVLNNAEVAEIPFQGLSYIYLEKKVEGLDNVFERLDKGVASMAWLASFPQAHV